MRSGVNKKARSVCDFRAVNLITVKNRYPLPDILQLFDRLVDSEFFGAADLKSGFYQVPMSSESVPITAITTSAGLFEFLVMPLGLSNAPSHFMT